MPLLLINMSGFFLPCFLLLNKTILTKNRNELSRERIFTYRFSSSGNLPLHLGQGITTA